MIAPFFGPMFCIFVQQLRIKYNHSHVTVEAEEEKEKHTINQRRGPLVNNVMKSEVLPPLQGPYFTVLSGSLPLRSRESSQNYFKKILIDDSAPPPCNLPGTVHTTLLDYLLYDTGYVALKKIYIKKDLSARRNYPELIIRKIKRS